MIHSKASRIFAQCLWAMDFLCKDILLLLLSAAVKPYELTVYIEIGITVSFKIYS